MAAVVPNTIMFKDDLGLFETYNRSLAEFKF